MTEFHQIPLINIIVPESRRKVDPDAVKELAASIMKFGLRNAITVRKVVRQGVYWDTTLVAGLHRLEAVRLLEHKSILATVITADDTDARLWEISENLHRAELTKLERNEQIAEWIKLTEAKEVSAQVEPKPQCGRPESGVRAAARELGVDRNEAQRSIKIAGITDEAKDAAREAGLDDNQSALLKVAAEPVEKQVEAVEQIVKAKAAAKTRPKTKTVTTAQHAQRRASAMHALSVFESKAKAEKPKQASEPVTITLSTAEYKVAADVAALETIATRASTPAELFGEIVQTLDCWSDADVREFSKMVTNYLIDRPDAKAAA